MPKAGEPFKYDGTRYAPGDDVSAEVAKKLPDGLVVSDSEYKKLLAADAAEVEADDDKDSE